jgi:hypothetical protein
VLGASTALITALPLVLLDGEICLRWGTRGADLEGLKAAL